MLRRLQLFFQPAKPETNRFAELEEMGRVLDNAPGIAAAYEQVLQDLGGNTSACGAAGLSVDLVVRLGIVQQRYQLTYRELEGAAEDSLSLRAFLGLGYGSGPKRSAMCSALKRVKAETWAKINDCVKSYAREHGIEDGRVVRGDTTVTETNIHHPTDASLLCDVVRVLTRPMERAKALLGIELASSNHHSRARARLYTINNTRKPQVRHKNYLDLIRVARKVIGYAQAALPKLEAHKTGNLDEVVFILKAVAELKTYIPLAERVLDQAYRRIVKNEKVPADEKLFSLFEPETDIIIKGQREIKFGHKVLVSTGKSSLILDLSVLDGNPADSTLVKPLLEEHIKFYGAAPEKMAFDGGFASAANRDLLKDAGVKEITFSKNLRMKLDTLVSSPRQHKLLMHFRAGIEGCISFMKRVFGFDRVMAKTEATFHAVLHCAAVAYNLTQIARANLAPAPA
jgi:IS5 family transposase